MARAHLRALRRLGPITRVFGVYDADPGTAQEFAGLAVSRAFQSLDAMLATVRPEVVHVCTTAGNHFEPARMALETGAHLYVEKPFVEQTPEAVELLALAAEKHRLVCCGHQLLADQGVVEFPALLLAQLVAGLADQPLADLLGDRGVIPGAVGWE